VARAVARARRRLGRTGAGPSGRRRGGWGLGSGCAARGDAAGRTQPRRAVCGHGGGRGRRRRPGRTVPSFGGDGFPRRRDRGR
jgi:hypothetical protein